MDDNGSVLRCWVGNMRAFVFLLVVWRLGSLAHDRYNAALVKPFAEMRLRALNKCSFSLSHRVFTTQER
ncbi:unnamed protein product [Prunus armeniaca]